MSQNNPNTPYFTTEYMETLIDHKGPNRNVFKI